MQRERQNKEIQQARTRFVKFEKYYLKNPLQVSMGRACPFAMYPALL
jgi:hypothetical protein